MNVEEGDNCSLLADLGGLMEFVGTVTLTVGVGNDSVVHKFVTSHEVCVRCFAGK